MYAESSHNVFSSLMMKRVHHANSGKFDILVKLGVMQFNEGFIHTKWLYECYPFPPDQINWKGLETIIKKENYQKKYIKEEQNRKRKSLLRKKNSSSGKLVLQGNGSIYQTGVGEDTLHLLKDMKEKLKDPSKIFSFDKEKD